MIDREAFEEAQRFIRNGDLNGLVRAMRQRAKTRARQRAQAVEDMRHNAAPDPDGSGADG